MTEAAIVLAIILACAVFLVAAWLAFAFLVGYATNAGGWPTSLNLFDWMDRAEALGRRVARRRKATT